MSIEYVIDRAIQFLLVEVLEAFINTSSNCISKLVSFFRNIQLNTNKSLICLSHIDILYKSENFIVLNKPPDLLINSNDSLKSTVQTILSKQLPDLRNPDLRHEFYFAHRLDFATSGILCIPLHRQACASICKSFEQQKCQKFYLAIINGHVQQEMCDVSLAIGDDIRYEKSSKKMCTGDLGELCKNPRNSHTRLVLLSRGMYRGLAVSKVLLQPVTGRRHQLRLHCAAIGHPILGDYTYGSINDKEMPRMYLHAISLIAPNDLEDLNIKTEDPFIGDEFGFSVELDLLAGIEKFKTGSQKL